METFDHKHIEAKWQEKWSASPLTKFDNRPDAKKNYCLIMFPYPSGDKLHLGHWYNYAPVDSWARFRYMNGDNVFEPIGFDSFGLPAENYAIKTGIHPDVSTNKNIHTMTNQLKAMGTMYCWDKTLATSKPSYYKWTQWLFLELFKQGLAYKDLKAGNWCESCQTILANEQVHEGNCERCGNEVIQKDIEQWFFRITDYAEELLDHSTINWPEKTRLMQTNWIGKSKGCEFEMEIKDHPNTKLAFYTTRIDTLAGVTYVVLAPEHPLVEKLTTEPNASAVKRYLERTKEKSELERTSLSKEKTGVFTGSYCIEPISGTEVPIWVADYVLGHYGTGAVMAVPAHDERDHEFALTHKLPIKTVVVPNDPNLQINFKEQAYTEYGKLFSSAKFTGLSSEEALEKITAWLESEGKGKATTNYRLRDWCISRQRYWGAPIPIVYCDDCGTVPVPNEDLPIKLPEDVDFKPTGESPLKDSEAFVNTSCPQCQKPAKREVDTMDTFVCSSWYFLRYAEANLEDKPFTKELVEKWLPVDMYVGGPEHACMHLLYSRFITKALADAGHFSIREPFKTLFHQGLVTKDGAKMSKSKGNVVSPDTYVEKFGSDALRLYIMFLGPFEDGGDWSDNGISGTHRFLKRIWTLTKQAFKEDTDDVKTSLHKTIKKCTEDIQSMNFNTAISSLMEHLNLITKTGCSEESFKTLLKLIAPLAPHLAEESWETLGAATSIFEESWPTYDESLTISGTIDLVVQVNGKLRANLQANKDISKEEAIALAKDHGNVQKFIEGKEIVKEIFVPGRLINIVVK